jgi:hypothetical protein
MLNKQSRTAEKGRSSRWGVGRGANNASAKKISLLRSVTKGLGRGRINWLRVWVDLTQDGDQWRALVNTVMNLLFS